MITLALTLTIMAAPTAEVLVDRALMDAARTANADIDVERVDVRMQDGCAPVRAEVLGTLTDGHSRVVIEGRRDGRHDGQPCQGFANVNARVTVSALVVDTAVRRGERVAAHVKEARVPRRQGRTPLTTISPDTVARQHLSPGRTLEDNDVKAGGPVVGTSVNVVLAQGALRIKVDGSVVECGIDEGPVCVRTKGGRKFSGVMVGNDVEVRQ